MQKPFQIIKHILRTEKGTKLEPQNKYIFCVNKKANKVQIKEAIEYIYRVKVHSVNTTVMPGKMRRVRYKAGKTPDWKKALVTLQKGQKINIT
ncbi:MAG: 50S ribosomal protein L23 [Candidatus Omnitrophica bacterium]|nr:50S ribosomal protein L23 [Candidatus Omnitrophota bacterium]